MLEICRTDIMAFIKTRQSAENSPRKQERVLCLVLSQLSPYAALGLVGLAASSASSTALMASSDGSRGDSPRMTVPRIVGRRTTTQNPAKATKPRGYKAQADILRNVDVSSNARNALRLPHFSQTGSSKLSPRYSGSFADPTAPILLAATWA